MFSLIWGIAKSYFFGEFPPRLNWAITDLCNSYCIFCEAPAGFKGKKDCSSDEALRICKELSLLGVKAVHMVGGEVFLRKDIWEVLAALKSYSIAVTITTNALTFHTFTETQKNILRECVARLRFSLDSTIPDQYDEIRGVKNAYVKISKAVEEWSRCKKPKAIVTSVIMRDNIDEIPQIVRWCSQNNIPFVDFQPLSPVSIFSNISSLKVKKTLLPQYADMPRLQKKIEEAIAMAKKLGVKTTLPFFKYYAPNYFLSLVADKDGFFFEEIVKAFSCIKVSLSAFLDYDGSLKLCPILSSAADIKRRSLKEGWQELSKRWEAIKKGHFPRECRFCFCNVAENIAFSIIKSPLRNFKLGKKIISQF